MVRELFEMARSKKACIIFFDEVDAIGGARFDDGAGGDNEVQRTMLELINQLDGFDARGNIKVIMATNRSAPRSDVHVGLADNKTRYFGSCSTSSWSIGQED
jgi:ATP-dependent 26S proteasome regulatory subunit